METKLINIESEKDYFLLDEAAEALKEGSLVAFPTETVYGLGANALDEVAVKKIYEAKGRPSDNPLIVHIFDTAQLNYLAAEISYNAHKVMEKFWPGPLTVIVKRSENVPDCVTAGLDTVAIRMPENKVALELLKRSGVPVAAPSANTSGKPSPTTAAHVFCDLKDKIPYIVNGGASRVGLESTVLDTTEEFPKILRPGGITKEQLEGVVGKVIYDPALSDPTKTPKSPGMKYKHYAPKAELTVLVGKDACKKAKELSHESVKRGIKTGIISAGDIEIFADIIFPCGETPEEYAAKLFDALRKMDNLGAEVIYAILPFEGDGIETAIRNRIFKSAAGRVIKC